MATPLKTIGLRLSAPSARQTLNCCSRPSFAQGLIRSKHTTAMPSTMLKTSSRSINLPLATSGRFFSSATTTSQSSGASTAALDWNSFFQLRVKRRRIQMFFSFTMGILGGAGGAILLSTGVAEPLTAQIPLDPFITLGLMTFSCAGLGWLVGPSVGNQVFYLLNRRFKVQMIGKEKEFFARVKKNRVDPTNSSAGNPVPDFYGEKIQSVAGYRRWLKDQRAFNRKKTAAFV